MALLEHMKDNQKKYSLLAAALVVGIGISWFSLRHNAYALCVDGEVIAVVKEKETIKSVYTNVIETIKNQEGTDIAVNETLAVEPVHSAAKNLSTEEQVKEAINNVVSYNVAAYEIMVDGESFAVVESREVALAILEDIANGYLPKDGSVVLKSEVATADETDSSGEAAKALSEEPESSQVSAAKSIDTPNVATENTETLEATGTPEAIKAPEVTETPSVSPEVTSETTKANISVNKEDLTTEGQSTETSQSNLNASPEPILDEQGREIVAVESALPEQEVKESVSVAELAVAPIIEDNKEDAEGQKIAREIKGLDFNEAVSIHSVYVPKEEILTAEKAEEILRGNKQETIEYELKEGDNIWDIAVKYGTTMEHILEINPQIEDETKMQIGEVIKLEVPDPILSIMTVTETTFKELIPAKIQYVWFSNLYEGETRVYQEGNDGLKEITVDVTKLNGKEVSRAVTGEKVLKEAKIKVISYGTKKKPVNVESTTSGASSSVSASSSGRFMHPLNGGGTISSTYGSRWGTFHYGLDFAASAGTPIYAAAGGEVIYSGYNNGGYGNLIIIDHGNGYQTYYAHCSSLYVNVGDTVSKGQNIAGVGTTGDSTGNHLHWEVRIDGTPVNPYSYVF